MGRQTVFNLFVVLVLTSFNLLSATELKDIEKNPGKKPLKKTAQRVLETPSKTKLQAKSVIKDVAVAPATAVRPSVPLQMTVVTPKSEEKWVGDLDLRPSWTLTDGKFYTDNFA